MKEFHEETRPQLANRVNSPTDVFKYLFSYSVIDYLIYQTNLYAVQKVGKVRFKEQSRMKC